MLREHPASRRVHCYSSGMRCSHEYYPIRQREIPTVDTGMDGTYVLQPGDRVVAGEGPEITTREEWAALLPSDYDVTTVTWVEQKYWHGQPCHVEAGA